ncbi:DUF6440 family protein [Clostridium estertheticum]|uniref:DUF6440 family protein n=1 Tax=Clostridium estertheticum TaxID=238834 RepID=UPI001CF30D06|nr:DUF6440 family protein [Clostridium estertheticum]MCB2308729.1 DUF6440 family protein [Clostridium estertheticum]MCB2347458.1 DUF6440 family protein [Clostridium estertheticum]MCB2351717.1 DUF6440 family protein [Clostridium estertheticum]WAG46296.1 DUF6440 family protein [Clostridium estertheticum]
MFNKKDKKENKRFKTIYEEGDMTSRCKIIVDIETGINYLINIDGYAGGITPLLDKDGKSVVSSIES